MNITEESWTSMNTEIEAVLRNDYVNDESVSKEEAQRYFEQMLLWLRSPPTVTCVRVNTLHTSLESARSLLQTYFDQEEGQFQVREHTCVPDTLIIHNTSCLPSPTPSFKEVIVDIACAVAVMRGAQVYAPGVIGAPGNLRASDHVSVFTDLEGKCLRGFKKEFNGKKLFLGNGICLMSRDKLFKYGVDNPRGLAVEITEKIYVSPSLGKRFEDLLFLQNLPSIVCSRVLDPQPGEMILDMCAAPGGKTTHIAALMKNIGRVVAIDKSESKVSKIKNNAKNLGITCIETFVGDSTQLLDSSNDSDHISKPSFPQSCFDRILLDVPCSNLGQRPMLSCHIKTIKELKSYQKLQRSFINVAVNLLKVGGILVYSTCTLTLAENEAQVKWILDTFPYMELSPQSPVVGGQGMVGVGLTDKQRSMIQRFEIAKHSLVETADCPYSESDSIGFFIAKFTKLKML